MNAHELRCAIKRLPGSAIVRCVQQPRVASPETKRRWRPVVVAWGYFAATVQWDGEVAYVDGDALADRLAEHPVDLRDERQRRAVREWLRALPRA